MTFQFCRDLILKNLQKVVANDYVLLDLPYFTNVGDVLIWQATEDLLHQLPHKCIYSASIESYRKPVIGQDVVIVFMGGGNFGDLWIRHQKFRHQVMVDFPHNPIVQLPQSVYFQNSDVMKEDALFFSNHQADVTIFLRDQQSYDVISANYLTVNAFLLPDMVLSLDIYRYAKLQSGEGAVLVERNDSEKLCYDRSIVPEYAEKRDWPTMEQIPRYFRLYNYAQALLARIDILLSTHLYHSFADFCFKHYFKKWIINSGIEFVNRYKVVYSTRLHVTILATLLDKEVIAFDNSYGKVKGVYSLWMKELKNIKMM